MKLYTPCNYYISGIVHAGIRESAGITTITNLTY